MAAAEARASGLPLIVPDRGAAIDQLVPGAGAVYRSGDEQSLARAITAFATGGPELQHARAVHHRDARTMDEHFEQLFGRYRAWTGSGEAAGHQDCDCPSTAFAVPTGFAL